MSEQELQLEAQQQRFEAQQQAQRETQQQQQLEAQQQGQLLVQRVQVTAQAQASPHPWVTIPMIFILLTQTLAGVGPAVLMPYRSCPVNTSVAGGVRQRQSGRCASDRQASRASA